VNLVFQPPIIAHRGDSRRAPENTLASLRLAQERGARWVEVDVKLTKDGIPILMHDDTLDRTTNGKGAVADKTWAEIQKLDAGVPFDKSFKGERVPHLAEVLKFVVGSGLHINLEIKPCPGRAQETARVMLQETAKLWPAHSSPPLISSFNEESLAIAKQMQPDWPRSLAMEVWRDDFEKNTASVGAQALTVDADLLTSEHMFILRKSGLTLLAYTVNDPAYAKKLLADGVHAVFSDDPGMLIESL
jgi:glycerophosphoryl diester phosphodiesterase